MLLKLYMVMSRESSERVEHFKYLGTALTDQNSMQEKIKSRLLPFGVRIFCLP